MPCFGKKPDYRGIFREVARLLYHILGRSQSMVASVQWDILTGSQFTMAYSAWWPVTLTYYGL